MFIEIYFKKTSVGRDVAAGVVVDIFQTQSQEDLLIYQLWSVSKRNTSRKSLKKKTKNY